MLRLRVVVFKQVRPAATDRSDGTGAYDPREPTGERANVAQPAEMMKRLNEGLLRRVLGGVAARHVFTCDTHGGLREGGDNVSKRVNVAGPRKFDLFREFGVHSASNHQSHASIYRFG